MGVSGVEVSQEVSIGREMGLDAWDDIWIMV